MRRGWLLVLGLGLLVVAAWLLAPAKSSRPARRELAFPRYQRPHEIERQRARTRAPSRRSASDAGAPRAPTPAEATEFDPVHVALGGGELALIVEARAVRGSPIGRKLLACLSPEQLAAIAELEQHIGFDPLERIERIGLTTALGESEPVLVLSGDFKGFELKLPGADAPIFETQGPRTLLASSGTQGLAVWDERLLVFGNTPAILDVVAKLEGEKPEPEPFPADEAYGEVYGRITGRALSELLPAPFQARVSEAAESVLLHLDATDDLLLVAHVQGEAGKVRDLAAALGGALAMGRLHAVEQDEALLIELLDQSRVIPGGDGFQLEMALPLAAIEDQLGACARDTP